MPISFVLPPDDVDALRKAAKIVLSNSKNFQKYLDEL